MKIFNRNIPSLVLLNAIALTVPIYLAGCGGANTSTSPGTAASSASGTGNSDSGSSGSSSSSGSGSSSGSSSSASSGSSSPAPSGAVAPAQALASRNLQKLSNWDGVYDTDTGGSSSNSNGTMSMTGSPSRSGSARKFVTRFTNNGGERYWVSFGADTAAKNFLYDGWVYFDNSSGSIANLELDMNQVLSNGQTVIYGVQCDGYSSTWDYTVNNGSPSRPKIAWVHSKAYCNPRDWKKNTWHHVQIAYSRDDAGRVTYKSAWLDGKKFAMNATVPSAFAIGWGSTLLTNFQVDGIGASGSATVYLDDLTIYRW